MGQGTVGWALGAVLCWLVPWRPAFWNDAEVVVVAETTAVEKVIME